MTAPWLNELLGCPVPDEGSSIVSNGRELVMDRGILRDRSVVGEDQQQTSDTFAFKWAQEDTYSSAAVESATRSWLVKRYGNLSAQEIWKRFCGVPAVLDAGCGAGLTARLLLGDRLRELHYIGVDISEAVDVALKAFRRANLPGAFLQADLCALPFSEKSFDFILSEGVLHHTPSTRAAISKLARHLKIGGLFAFYVYARKSPVREFTDDMIRSRLSGMSPREAWEALISLTKLGKALGDLNISVDVPEDVPLLGIPKGRIDVQRLIYWHICKMYHRPEYSLEEMNHVNFDWFTPTYCHRQTPEEIRTWCSEAGLTIEAMNVEEAGITTIAQRAD